MTILRAEYRAEQIVRERNQQACDRQLVRNAVVSRRVNFSIVGRLLASDQYFSYKG